MTKSFPTLPLLMTKTPPLFPDEPTLPANPSDEDPARTVRPKAAARVLMPNRNQLELRARDLELP